MMQRTSGKALDPPIPIMMARVGGGQSAMCGKLSSLHGVLTAPLKHAITGGRGYSRYLDNGAAVAC